MAGLVAVEHVEHTEHVEHVEHVEHTAQIAGIVPHPPPPAARRRLRSLRTTPGKLIACVAVAVLLACGLGVVIAAVFGGVGAGFSAIGTSDAPLVEESTGLYFSVNDMDAQVANVLLTGNDPGLAADRQEDLNQYAQDRQRAEQDLRQVTVTAATDPAAQRPPRRS
jgi:hypothetical protein